MEETSPDGERLRSIAVDRLLADPMMAAALTAHGLRRDGLPWEAEEFSMLDAVRCKGDGTRPAVILDSNGEGNLWWHSLGGHSFSYDVGRDGRVLTIGDVEIPSTTLIALAGRPLAVIAALPGANALTIVEAEARPVIAGDRNGARVTVEPVA